jgi:hypothetical protein
MAAPIPHNEVCSDSVVWQPLDPSPDTWFMGRFHFTRLRHQPSAVSAEVLLERDDVGGRSPRKLVAGGGREAASRISLFRFLALEPTLRQHRFAGKPIR